MLIQVPPSLRILWIVSMYDKMLVAVSIKKQVTTTSHAPVACIYQLDSIMSLRVESYVPWLLSSSPYTSTNSPAAIEKSTVDGRLDGTISGTRTGASCCDDKRMLEKECTKG